MYQPCSEPDNRDSGAEEWLGQQVAIVEHEKGILIDIHDIVSESMPGWDDRKTANPLREAYALMLSSLLVQMYDLANLQVSTGKLLSLLKVLQILNPPDNSDKQEVLSSMIDFVEKLDSHGKVNWEGFNTLITKHGVSYPEHLEGSSTNFWK
jgi:hypothetical protein